MTYSETQIVKIPQPQLMANARESLKGKWGLAAGTFFIYMVIAGALGLIPLASFFIGGPFALGIAIFALNIARDQEANVSNIFDGFQNFVTALGAYILIALAVIVGMIFLIIPGIIAGIGLSQTMFIIADDPEIGAVDALKKSWAMMDGHKMDYFVLGLRFIPWVLLSILTLFIGLLWVMPYAQVTFAKFYDMINGREDEDDIAKHLVD